MANLKEAAGVLKKERDKKYKLTFGQKVKVVGGEILPAKVREAKRKIGVGLKTFQRKRDAFWRKIGYAELSPTPATAGREGKVGETKFRIGGSAGTTQKEEKKSAELSLAQMKDLGNLLITQAVIAGGIKLVKNISKFANGLKPAETKYLDSVYGKRWRTPEGLKDISATRRSIQEPINIYAGKRKHGFQLPKVLTKKGGGIESKVNLPGHMQVYEKGALPPGTLTGKKLPAALGKAGKLGKPGKLGSSHYYNELEKAYKGARQNLRDSLSGNLATREEVKLWNWETGKMELHKQITRVQTLKEIKKLDTGISLLHSKKFQAYGRTIQKMAEKGKITQRRATQLMKAQITKGREAANLKVWEEGLASAQKELNYLPHTSIDTKGPPGKVWTKEEIISKIYRTKERLRNPLVGKTERYQLNETLKLMEGK